MGQIVMGPLTNAHYSQMICFVYHLAPNFSPQLDSAFTILRVGLGPPGE